VDQELEVLEAGEAVVLGGDALDEAAHPPFPTPDRRPRPPPGARADGDAPIGTPGPAAAPGRRLALTGWRVA